MSLAHIGNIEVARGESHMLAVRLDNHTIKASSEEPASTAGFDDYSSPVRSEDPAATVQRLQELLARRRRWQAHRAGWHRRFIPTGLIRLDAVLPSGGLPCGAVTEILAPGPGFGAFSLALRIARQVLQPSGPAAARAVTVSQRESARAKARGSESDFGKRSMNVSAAPAQLIIVDTDADLYPPALSAFGIGFEQLIVLRVPERGRAREEALWAVDQALRCRTVAAVIVPLSQLDERQARRLQLAAEQGGGIALLLRPERTRG